MLIEKLNAAGKCGLTIDDFMAVGEMVADGEIYGRRMQLRSSYSGYDSEYDD